MSQLHSCSPHAATEPLVGSYFVSTYPPFSCWNEAGAQAYASRLTIPHADGAPFGLYVHVPFCVERCHYCYYLSHDDRAGEMERYLEALAREVEMLAAQPAVKGRPLDFVYFGGGTPSILSIPRLEVLFQRLQQVLSWDQAREVTFECAPRSVTLDKLRVLHEAGVTRISMGVQSMDDAVLARNGRVHSSEDVRRAYNLIRQVGFPVVNLDAIVGLVDEDDASFESSLGQLLVLEPDSLTLYQLEIPLNTPLYRALEAGQMQAPASWPTKRARADRAFRALESRGYHRRSAYAAVRDVKAHRFLYQEEQYRGTDLLGAGVSSFSYLDGHHHQNVAALRPYLEALESDQLPWNRGAQLSPDERLVREFILSLKLGRVDRAGFRQRHGVDAVERFGATLKQLVAAEQIEIHEDALQVTRSGLLQIDRLLPRFYLPRHRGVRYS